MVAMINLHEKYIFDNDDEEILDENGIKKDSSVKLLYRQGVFKIQV
jgi:hypothetical protein